MRDASIWFAIYMVWLSAAATAWPLYAVAAWRAYIGVGGGTGRFAIDVTRFVRFMTGGDMGAHLYEPGQKLRFGITLTLSSTMSIAAFYWQLDRHTWTPAQLAVNAAVVVLSYIGIMVHLYVAWRDRRELWRLMVWAQVVLFFVSMALFPLTGWGDRL